MAGLSVPEKYKKGVVMLLRLKSSSVRAIIDTLASQPPDVPTKKIAAIVNSEGERRYEGLQESLRALKSLYAALANSEVALDDFLDELTPAVFDIVPQTDDELDESTIRSRLEQLLSVEPVLLHAKIQSLKSSEERAFCRARIDTDLRPVFINGESQPRGFFLTHRLQLGFHQQGGKHQDFYVSLDEQDIAELKAAIYQAEQKIADLQSSLERVRNPRRKLGETP